MTYAIIFGIGAVVATFCGGLFALHFRDKLHLILGFSAGAVIAVAFFDLLPEALSVGISVPTEQITFFVGFGFVVYMILDRTISLHAHNEEGGHSHRRSGLGVGSLSLHSFLDGFAIGISFHVSFGAGLLVALAVLAHDFSDGINTVGLVVRSGGRKKDIFRWLIIDSLAPFVGILASFFFSFSENYLALILALFSGFFLYLGASDLLPESHHDHPTYWTTIMTVLGVVSLYAVISFV